MLRLPRFFRTVGRLTLRLPTASRLRRGLREQVYLDWGDALEAVGLSG
jgi:hypothetical protein